jgi:hypothetical protein
MSVAHRIWCSIVRCGDKSVNTRRLDRAVVYFGSMSSIIAPANITFSRVPDKIIDNPQLQQAKCVCSQ